MRELYRELRRRLDPARMMKHTAELTALELPQTFGAYHAAARRCTEILRRCGLPQVEELAFPADGRTVYQDKRMPLAWEASRGKLTILAGPGLEPGFVAADYARHPFELIKGSVATPPAGTPVRIVTAAQMLAGTPVAGALVLTEPGKPPQRTLVPALDRGALGIVSDFLKGHEEAPDHVQWVTALTEFAHWHVQCEDRPFLAFSVSPGAGRRLRRAAEAGEVTALAESDGRRFEGEVPFVTALLPGRRPEEVWLLAHLFEPLANDNSTGVAAAIETALAIQSRGTPEFSVRLLFGMELYGFAAYAASRGEHLRHLVVGGCDYDAMYVKEGWTVNLLAAGPASPFFGNYLLEELATELAGKPGVPPLTFCRTGHSMYDDDVFLSDRSTGVPVVWPRRQGAIFWHNSIQTVDYIDVDAFHTGAALNAAFIAAVASPPPEALSRALAAAERELADARKKIAAAAIGSDAERFRHMYEMLAAGLADFARCRPEAEVQDALDRLRQSYETAAVGLADAVPHSEARDRAAKLIPARRRHGQPNDLVHIPKPERRRLPDNLMYGPLANVLANMDGAKDLARLIREAEYENERALTEAAVAAYVDAVEYLAKYGYLSLELAD